MFNPIIFENDVCRKELIDTGAGAKAMPAEL